MSDLPDFKLIVTKNAKTMTLQFREQTADFILYEGKVDGWELDDFITSCIKQLTDTAEVKKSLFQSPPLDLSL